MNCKKIAFFLVFLMASKFLFATHNRAGELSYTQISALQYEFILTTFTDISDPNNADRPSAELNFGDGTCRGLRPRPPRPRPHQDHL